MKQPALRSRLNVIRATSFVVLLAVSATPAAARQRPAPADTVVALDAVVVTADRAGSPLAASVSSVSRLTAPQLARSPQVTLADALRQLPGFDFVDFDGLGFAPQAVVRGFYGGGEAEYILVMVDGRPINDVQGGGIAWDALPVGDIERVELVRGGASPVWGDAALGGVVNVITRGAASPATRLSAGGGTFGTWRFDARAQTAGVARGLDLSGGATQTDGFREHSARTVWRGGADVALLDEASRRITVSAHAHRREFEEPGPLTEPELRQNRSASDPFYRFDHTDDRAVRAGTDVQLGMGTVRAFTAGFGYERRATDAVRTLVLAPEFADTKERELRTGRLAGSAQLTLDGTGLPVDDRLVVGVDAARSSIDSKYYAVVTGPRAVYGVATGERGDLDTAGDGGRTAGAAFAHYTLLPHDAVRVTLGARADWIRDAFEPASPAGERVRTTHEAFSPRFGVNARYLGGANAGHVWAGAGRSFKAPTLDQLFDQRRIPVPFPPFAVSTSNAELVPQHGITIEGGIYQTLVLAPTVTADLTVSAYRMRMKDELDFDIATLRYVNIGRSRHRGIETGLRVNGPGGAAAWVNVTRQSVVAKSGEDVGRQIRAVPRTLVSGGVSIAPLHDLEAGLFVTHSRDTWLDSGNTIELAPFTRTDARVAYRMAGVQIFADVRNLLDATYSTTGFPDPSGSGTMYYFPAAGRAVELGIRR